MIRRNLEPIAAEDRALLTTAAVIGYDFDVARLGAVSELPPDRLLERLEIAAEAGVVEEIHGASGHFRFAHMLIRDAFYGELSPLARARLHRKVGLALEDLHQGARDKPCAELARHFVPAAVLGDAGKALECARRRRQRSSIAYEAVGHFEVALKVLWLDDPTSGGVELRMSLGQAQAYAATTHERATYQRAPSERGASATRRPSRGPRSDAGGARRRAVYPALVAMLEERWHTGEADGAPARPCSAARERALLFA